MSITRTHPWRTFLCAAVAINALCFALVRLVPRPQVEIGAAVDVAITVPALYLLLIVRAGLQPAISVVPLLLLGVVRATYLAPPPPWRGRRSQGPGRSRSCGCSSRGSAAAFGQRRQAT